MYSYLVFNFVVIGHLNLVNWMFFPGIRWSGWNSLGMGAYELHFSNYSMARSIPHSHESYNLLLDEFTIPCWVPLSHFQRPIAQEIDTDREYGSGLPAPSDEHLYDLYFCQCSREAKPELFTGIQWEGEESGSADYSEFHGKWCWGSRLSIPSQSQY